MLHGIGVAVVRGLRLRSRSYWAEEETMDDELIGQLREVTGERISTCELCGRPTVESDIVVLERRSPLEPEEGLRICSVCKRQMEANELPVEVEKDAEALAVDDV
jgi:hypothetical protein